MTVKELIEELSKFNETCTVSVEDSFGGNIDIEDVIEDTIDNETIIVIRLEE